MLKFLQINLRKSRLAQDLLLQVAMERKIDMLIVSEQHNKSDQSTWYQDSSRRAGIIIINKKLVVSDFKNTKFGFSWVEVDGIRIYSCYFPPNDQNDKFEKFKKDIDELEASLKTSKGDVLIAGDFNSKSPEWGETRSDRRGKTVCEFVARNDLVIINKGDKCTFQRGEASSIIDLTIGSTRLARRIKDWEVLDDESLSDHRYIVFSVAAYARCHNDKAQFCRGRPTWNARKLNPDKARESLEDSRLIRSIGWIKRVESLESIVKDTKEIVMTACNASMPKRRGPMAKTQVYWWTPEIAELRKKCIRARRLATRARNNMELKEQYKISLKLFKREIKRSKARCWKELLNEVENDPWGMAYKIVTKKFQVNRKTPGLDDPQWVKKIIRDLFPIRDRWIREKLIETPFDERNFFTKDELLGAAKSMKLGKAPGPDGIPSEILRIVAEDYPECLLSTFNSCLKHGTFFKQWKKQRLVLLRKGSKPIDQTSSFRPLCLLDTMGKLLEGLLLIRLERHFVGENNLSSRQYGFRKGLSTTDAILEVIHIAEKAKRGDGRKKGFCALVAIDIRNAFNSATWKDIIQALVDMNVPEYLLRMVEDYLHERSIEYRDAFVLEEDVTCGVPQGSRLGPVLWNVMYDKLLRIETPIDSQLIGYADDTLIICHSDNVDILEMKVNETLFRVNRWLEKRLLHMAVEKTEAVLITDRRAFRFPNIRVGNANISWKRQITYLGVVIDHKLNFGPHVNITADKAAKTASNISRLMPNIGGPREAKRRLISSAAHSQMLYAAPVWAEKLAKDNVRSKYVQVQRRLALRIVSAYRTVSDSAVGVLASLPPIDLLAKERKTVFEEVKRLRVSSRGVEQNSTKDAIKKRARTSLLADWQERWNYDVKGRWTHQLIPYIEPWFERRHGVVNFYVAQVLSGHGCFKSYLHRFKRANDPMCVFCGHEDDDAMHTIFVCTAWDTQRSRLSDDLGVNISPSNIIQIMLRSEKDWSHVQEFLTYVMKQKEVRFRT